MTELAIQASSRVRHSARPSVEKQRLRRLAAAAIGDISTSPEAAALTPVAMGVVSALCVHLAHRSNLEELGSGISVEEVHGVLASRGLSVGDSEAAISSLLAAKVLRMGHPGALELPGFEAVLSKQLRSFANRAEGWDRRSAPVVVERAARPVLELVSPPQAPLVPEVPMAAAPPTPTKVAVAKRKAPARSSVYRLGGEKDDVEPSVDDPTVARVESECGGVAEITQSRINHLQTVFPRVDVLEQVRLAATWVQGQPQRRKTLRGTARFLFTWLTNASDRARMRADQAAISNERNGFGQGGQYLKPSGDAQASMTTADDDFADLAAFEESAHSAAPVTVPVTAPPPAPALPTRVSPLALARARMAQRDVPTVSTVSAAPQRQRRLSEQLR